MANTPTRINAEAIAYCAKCDLEYCKTSPDFLDFNFTCRNDDPNKPKHLARVVKGPSGKYWLRIEQKILSYELYVSPMRWFKSWWGCFKGKAGRYLLFRFLVLLFALNSASSLCNKPSIGLLLWNVILILGTIFILFDILVANTSIAFISRFPAHPLRSVFFTIFGFIQIATAFSIFYVMLGNNLNEELTPFRAFYFSFITITTLGYGEILPQSESYLAMFTIVSELLSGLFFLVVIFSLITSWVSERPLSPKTKKLEDLCPNNNQSQGGRDTEQT